MARFKKNFVFPVVLLVFGGLLFAAVAPGLAAGIFEQMKNGFLGITTNAYGISDTAASNPNAFLNGLINIVNFILTFLGVIFFLIILYAGWLWLTARGNNEAVERAKKILQEAIIGLIIVFFARLITELALRQIGAVIYTQ